MPELPEVETLRRSLLPLLLGRSITRAHLFRPDIADSASPAGLLQGSRIVSLSRHGKQLALFARDKECLERALVIQLGMTGQVLVDPAPDLTHVHAEWRTEDNRRFVFRDPRRFGRLRVFLSHERLHAAWQSLGPDALTITARTLAPALAATTRAVKPALLDQSILAGVGNIYADESLFAAGIHPKLRADRVSPPQVERLARAIRETLARAILAGGSTLRDSADAYGRPGGFQLEHRVYARAGKPCVACTATLLGSVLAQRATVWCPECQPFRASEFSTGIPHRRAGRASPTGERKPARSLLPMKRRNSSSS